MNPNASKIAQELRAKSCALTMSLPLTQPVRYELRRTDGNGETVLVGTWDEVQARLRDLPSKEDVGRAFSRARGR